MATTNIDGSPHIAARLQFTGATAGDFTVEDYNAGAPIVRFTVGGASGAVTVTSKIIKAGPVEIMNGTSGASAMMDLSATSPSPVTRSGWSSSTTPAQQPGSRPARRATTCSSKATRSA